MNGQYIYKVAVFLFSVFPVLWLSACGKNPADRGSNPLTAYPELTEYVDPEIRSLLLQRSCMDTFLIADPSAPNILYGPQLNYSSDSNSNFVICLPEKLAPENFSASYISVTSEVLGEKVGLQELPKIPEQGRQRWLLSLNSLSDSVEGELITLAFEKSSDTEKDQLGEKHLYLVFELKKKILGGGEK